MKLSGIKSSIDLANKNYIFFAPYHKINSISNYPLQPSLPHKGGLELPVPTMVLGDKDGGNTKGTPSKASSSIEEVATMASPTNMGKFL